MKTRTLIIGASTLLCLVLVGTVFARRQQLADLRAAQQHLLGAASAADEQPATGATLPDSTQDIELGNAEKNELLRLRNQVSQLTQRKKELEVIRSEHQRLESQLAAKGTNASSLPAGYIRTREARWVGLATPDDTLQSFLWCIQNRDLTNLTRVVTPKFAAQITNQFKDASREFDETLQVLPGFTPVERTQLPDGSIMIQVEIVPGAAGPKLPMHLIPINGEWKLDMP